MKEANPAGGCEFLAMPERASAPKRVIFSLWAGPLPVISELHFLSTLAHMGSAQYVLFLDSSNSINLDFPTELEWIKSEPKITIREIDVSSFLASEGFSLAGHSHILNAHPGSLFRKFLRIWFGFLSGIQTMRERLAPSSKNQNLLPFGVEDNVAFGITAGHGYSRWVPASDLTYRADLFRLLAPAFFPESDVLWLDLDVAVLSDLDWLDNSQAFTYRWGRLPFANNAVLFLPATSPSIRHSLVSEMRARGTARPWTLLSDAFCDFLGIEIKASELFDPFFLDDNVLSNDHKRLFTSDENSAELAQHFKASLLMLHWHNQWALIPPQDSAFGHLLDHYRNSPLTTERR